MTEREFNTFLFYVFELDAGQTFVGAFSEGRMTISEPTGGEFAVTLQRALQERVPLERQLDSDVMGTVL